MDDAYEDGYATGYADAMAGKPFGNITHEELNDRRNEERQKGFADALDMLKHIIEAMA